jgi:hypothetical protein
MSWIDRFEVLMSSRRLAGFETRLKEFVVAPYDPGHAQEDESERRRWLALLTELSHTLSPEQRDHLRARLDRFAADFELLAREPAG